MLSAIQWIGIFYLVFRIWILEFRTKHLLGFRTRYISRFLSYFLAIGMIMDLQNVIMNLIIVYSFYVVLIATFVSDFTFLIKGLPQLSKSGEYSKVQIRDLGIERGTLHFPHLIVASYMMIMDLNNYIDFSQGFLSIFYAGLIFLSTFLIFDHRIKVSKKADWPEGPFILIGIIISFIPAIVFMYKLNSNINL